MQRALCTRIVKARTRFMIMITCEYNQVDAHHLAAANVDIRRRLKTSEGTRQLHHEPTGVETESATAKGKPG